MGAKKGKAAVTQRGLFDEPEASFYDGSVNVPPLEIEPITDEHREVAKGLKHGAEALEWAEATSSTPKEMKLWHDAYYDEWQKKQSQRSKT